jgi:hypothetical protein
VAKGGNIKKSLLRDILFSTCIMIHAFHYFYMLLIFGICHYSVDNKGLWCLRPLSTAFQLYLGGLVLYDKDVGIINLMIPDLLLVLIVYYLTVLLQRGKQQELLI